MPALAPRLAYRALTAAIPAPQGFGWAIAKCLAEAGAEISLGVWVPALNIFETSFRRGAWQEGGQPLLCRAALGRRRGPHACYSLL